MNEGADRIVAYALLTEDDLTKLGSSLRRVYPLTHDTTFDEHLTRLDAVKLPTRGESGPA